MPRHVEGDDAVVGRDTRIVEEAAELAPVGARGVQAQQRNARPRLLEIEAMRAAEQVEIEVAAGDRLDARPFAALSPSTPARSCQRPVSGAFALRGDASTSLK